MSLILCKNVIFSTAIFEELQASDYIKISEAKGCFPCPNFFKALLSTFFVRFSIYYYYYYYILLQVTTGYYTFLQVTIGSYRILQVTISETGTRGYLKYI